MIIRTRLGVSLDGYISTPNGWPALLSMPGFVPAKTHGYLDFIDDCGAVVMGRTTFKPALSAPSWPWPDLKVFVLTSSPLPPGTPVDVITASSPKELVAKMEASDFRGDVHLVGGPQTIDAFLEAGLLDRLELVVLPLLIGGGGLKLSTEQTPFTRLNLLSQRSFPDGSVELSYATRIEGEQSIQAPAVEG
jgi:dihydrofolate reductase